MGLHEEGNEQAVCAPRFHGRRLFLFIVAIMAATFSLCLTPLETMAQGRADLVWSSASGQGLTSVAYAPDGQTVFVGQSDRAATLWRASDGTSLKRLAFGEIGCGTVNDVTYSPDSLIVAAISGCTARLFNASDGTLIRKLNTGGGANAFHAATSLAFSPNGQLLATALVEAYPRRGTITLWNVLTGAQIWTASGGGGSNVAFSPDGLVIASVGGKGLDLLRASDGAMIRNIPGPQKALAFSPDGTLIATAGLAGGEYPGDDTIEFYRVNDGTLASKLTRTGKVTSVAFTPDGQGLISSGYDDNQNAVNGYINSTGTLHVWRLSDGALLKTYDKETGVSIPEVTISPDGKFFLYPGSTYVNLARIPDISNNACTFSISPKTATHKCQGGTGSVTVTASASCNWKAESRVDWIRVTTGASGTGNGKVEYTVASNDCNALPGSDLTIDGLLIIGEQTFDVKQNLAPPPASFEPTPTPTPTPTSTPTPTPTPISTPTPTPTPSPTPEPTPNPTPMPTPTPTPTPSPTPGDEIPPGEPPVVYFFVPDNPPYPEPDPSITVTVKRTGDLSQASDVNYATADGTAQEGRDYEAASGTLHFAAGESEKSISVLLINDGYAEPDETLTLTLMNASGAQLGTPRVSSLTIHDEDAGVSGNPVDDSLFFVRQHYLDFLGRDGDPSGQSFWTTNVERCGSDAQCLEVMRVDTSAAFFLSIEFQRTGYLAYRMYKAAFGNLPSTPVPLRRGEFLPDTERLGREVVVGRAGWEQQLIDNKNGFALEFVARQRFADAYPANMSAQEFVSKLNANTGGSLTQAEVDALAQELSVAGNTLQARAVTLSRVAENAEFSRREFTRAFVLTQYFGYLRRDPDRGPDSDFSGYSFWLSKLEQFDGDYRRAEMVKAFISSDEYRKRFGQ